ncbi:hypothetical protein Cch01nite_05550 [Cellulomonas chitinilytica]|uniref:Methyltransferase FkbM domain-containing protein n=1 Tax=Cellulomonas chitinilytica TaxID=398759 RepID=A0A919P1A9_9CELL|nr:hypothetical protein Cch01nite_05550 [Cellulomonas chitinilytica]
MTGAYRWISLVRYRNAWEADVPFRGAVFSIGRDLSLYPAVRNGGFESVEMDAFLPRVPDDALVWDVGANVGIYAVLLSRAAPKGRVVAFEPVPESRARLSANLEKNHAENVTVEPVALSNHSGTARMTVHPEAHGCDQISLSPADDGVEVETATGDRFASRYGDPDVIKVDIEGHEPEFLEGCWDMLERRKPLLMLEVNPTTWSTPQRYATWADTLGRLLTLYSEADWIDAVSSTRVSSVAVGELAPHTAYTMILPAVDGRPGPSQGLRPHE